MVATGSILYGKCFHQLEFNNEEHPVAVQLGGSDTNHLIESSKICEEYGYDEINLNVGCPSDRVQSGRFGACLMAEPQLVADCCSAIMTASDLPVTVKCRIGIDDMDPEAGLDQFVDRVADAGVRIFYVHARKAWLKGLSPKENRDIPPLDYDRARRLAMRRDDLGVILNGGLETKAQITNEIAGFAGVMLGRAAYRTPYVLTEIANDVFGATPPSRRQVAEAMADYADRMTANHVPLHSITRHMLGLYAGQRGAKHWRRQLGEQARLNDDGGAFVRKAADECEILAARLAA